MITFFLFTLSEKQTDLESIIRVKCSVTIIIPKNTFSYSGSCLEGIRSKNGRRECVEVCLSLCTDIRLMAPCLISSQQLVIL
jgi:hypothetical protein